MSSNAPPDDLAINGNVEEASSTVAVASASCVPTRAVRLSRSRNVRPSERLPDCVRQNCHYASKNYEKLVAAFRVGRTAMIASPPAAAAAAARPAARVSEHGSLTVGGGVAIDGDTSATTPAAGASSLVNHTQSGSASLHMFPLTSPEMNVAASCPQPRGGVPIPSLHFGGQEEQTPLGTDQLAQVLESLRNKGVDQQNTDVLSDDAGIPADIPAAAEVRAGPNPPLPAVVPPLPLPDDYAGIPADIPANIEIPTGFMRQDVNSVAGTIAARQLYNALAVDDTSLPNEIVRRRRSRSAPKKCTAEGCKSKAQQGGVCIKHGAKVKVKLCKAEGCTNQAQNGGVCYKHGAKRYLCKAEGCKSKARNRGVCDKHGAKRYLCKAEGCKSKARNRGVCEKHGAKVKVKLCTAEGCKSKARNRGVCYKHGPMGTTYETNPEATAALQAVLASAEDGNGVADPELLKKALAKGFSKTFIDAKVDEQEALNVKPAAKKMKN